MYQARQSKTSSASCWMLHASQDGIRQHSTTLARIAQLCTWCTCYTAPAPPEANRATRPSSVIRPTSHAGGNHLNCSSPSPRLLARLRGQLLPFHPFFQASSADLSHVVSIFDTSDPASWMVMRALLALQSPTEKKQTSQPRPSSAARQPHAERRSSQSECATPPKAQLSLTGARMPRSAWHWWGAGQDHISNFIFFRQLARSQLTNSITKPQQSGPTRTPSDLTSTRLRFADGG